MKSVFIAGSRKFSDEINLAIGLLTKEGISAYTGRKACDKSDDDTEFSDTMRERIEASDVVYVVAKDGYIGETVRLEIFHALSKKKEIVSSEIVKEADIQKLISKIMNTDELIAYLRDSP